jgi:opacity protein-like surface antigen
MRKINKTIVSALCLGMATTLSVDARASDQWEYEVTPYMLFAGMDGTLGIRDHTADVDMSFSDIWDSLDAGFMGLFTARKGPWMFGLEGVYMKLDGEKGSSFTGPGGIIGGDGELKVTASMYVYQGTLGYRLVDDRTRVDLIGGVRYTKLHTKMDVKVAFDQPPFDDVNAGLKGSDSWFDGVVGVWAHHPVSEEVSLVGYADVGGGGSDLTYQFMAGVNWEFKEDLTAKLGYRYLSWDYEDGGTVWDMSASGPYLGLGFRF